MGQAVLGLGRVFLWRRDLQKSAQYLNRALSLSEKREAALEVLARTEMGKLRFEEGSFNLAREHLSKAIQAASGLKSPESENAAKAWLSRCLGRDDDVLDPELKRTLAYAAREFFLGVDEKQGLVVSLIACADAEAALNRSAEADALFHEAVREARESGNPVLEAMACEAYSAYLKDQDDDLAQVMLERSRWARARIR
jgi:tetratricopeptide (TPR) repeat protein